MNDRVAFFVTFNVDGYSGGRIHAFLMALALSYSDFKVEIFSNAIPKFSADYSEYQGFNDIAWHVKNDLQFKVPNGRYDFVVVIPNRSNNYNFYLEAARFALKKNAKVLLLDFESESWFNSVSPFRRDSKEWYGSHRFGKYADIILSSAYIASSYAKKDFRYFISNPVFEYCYPSINSICAKKYLTHNKKRQIVFISRWNDPHKNLFGIIHIIDDYLRGYEMIFIVGGGIIPDYFVLNLRKKANKYDISVKILCQICDEDKYKIISESKAMVFLSQFEGFGLPPIEAQYCGVPCVCFDLPVLREVNGDSIVYADQGDYKSLKLKLNECISGETYDEKFLRQNVAPIAEFHNYAERLKAIFEKYRKRKTSFMVRIAQRFALNMELAISFCEKLYLKRQPLNNELTVSLINAYVQMRWKNILEEIPDGRIGVYGSEDYCIWLHQLTSKETLIKPRAIVEKKIRTKNMKLWVEPVYSASEFDPNQVNAIVLATECYQKEYSLRCKELYGNKILLIDLYEGLPKGPYPKGL